MATQRFLAVRVTLTHDDGSTVTRDYVRGTKRMSEATFYAFALGDLIGLTTSRDSWIKWDLHEVSAQEVFDATPEVI